MAPILRQPNVLCIGTTGMLSGMTQALVENGNRVHAIARTAQSLELCVSGLDQSIRKLLTTQQSDYADEHAWTQTLDRISEQICGPIDSVVCWIHSSSVGAFDQVLERFPDADILRVLSSQSKLCDRIGHSYRTVTLGFVNEVSSSRWLTHSEISSGVYAALNSDRKASLVGMLDRAGQ